MSMGEGDPEMLIEITEDLRSMTSGELESKYGTSYHQAELADGRILAISQTSHTSPNGGNMIILFPDGSTIEFMGHVCGDSFFGMVLRSFTGEHKEKLVAQYIESDTSEAFNIHSLLTVQQFKEWLPSYLTSLNSLDDYPKH